MASPLTRKTLEGLIFDSIDEINQQLSQEKQIEKSECTVLLGKGGKLDSLGLINLLAEIEQRVEEQFGVTITLTDGDVMSQKESPFANVGALTDYIFLLLKNKVNE
jgi:acyl carrier protein